MIEGLKERGTQLLSLVILVLLWQVASLIAGAKLMPPPADVLPLAWSMVIAGDFAEPLFTSLFRLFTGFFLALLIGIPFGIAQARLFRFSIAVTPIITIIMTIPSLVIIFVAMLVLGQTDSTILFIITLIVFPFVSIYVRDALKDIDQEVLSMADSFKVTTRRKITDVYIPYLVPPILGAIRVGFTMSWKMVILSEVFGFTSGIGWKINLSYFHYDLPSLVAWIVIFALVILVIEQVIRTGERAIVKWK